MFSLLAGSVEGHRKKLPAGVVPIFSSSSGSGLFDDEEEEEEEEGGKGKEGAEPHVHVPSNLGICLILRLHCAFSES